MMYREYSEKIDKLGYLSYKMQDFNYKLACGSEFRSALVELKNRAKASKKNLNHVDVLNDVIKTLVTNDSYFYNWCKNKLVCLEKIIPSSSNSQEALELAEMLALLHMVQKGNAIFTAKSQTLLVELVQGLDQYSSTILAGVKLLVLINYSLKPFNAGNTNPVTERLMSVIDERSFVLSKDAFHTCCANEFRYMSELTIKTLLKSENLEVCNQFFKLRDNQAKTPLIAATLFGMQDAAKLIINAVEKKKIEIGLNDKDDQGYTALDYAFLLGYTDLVLLLLQKGARFSSLDVIKEVQKPSVVNFVFTRAILCPERHFLAMYNYFYFNTANGLPIMRAGDDLKWRFVIMHPQNPDALTLIKDHRDKVHATSLCAFELLQQQPSTKTLAQNRLESLSCPVFLKKLVFLLARLGLGEEVQILLEAHPNLDLLRLDSGMNLLHLCTNSHALTSKHLNPFTPNTYQDIVAGRVKLVEYLIKHYPKLTEEMTTTSVGEEQFVSIVERMYEKQRLFHEALKPVNLFDDLLYSQLKQCLEKVGICQSVRNTQVMSL